MRVFVAGAGGYLAGAVARALGAAGQMMTGLVRGPEKAAWLEAWGARPLTGGPRETESYAEHADTPVHAAIQRDGPAADRLADTPLDAARRGAESLLYVPVMFALGETGPGEPGFTGTSAPGAPWPPEHERLVRDGASRADETYRGSRAQGARVRATWIAALVLAAAPAGAQEADGFSMASYRRARAEVEAGLAALGGPAPALSFTLEGTRGLRGQSAGPESAGERTPYRVRMMVEPARERALVQSESHLPGGIHFVLRRVAQGRSGFSFDVPRTRLGPALMELAAPAAAAVRTQAMRAVPQLLLAQALARPATLRDLGTVTRDGRPHRAVAYATEEGAQVTLFLDSGTRLLSGYELLEDNPGVGDVLTEVRFADYAGAAGVRLPTRYQVRQNGVMDQDLRYTALAAGALPDSLFAAPAGYTPPPPAGAASVQMVAEGVYLLDRIGGPYRSMFVDMGDHVLVVEAPVSSAASEAALALIRRTVPGKPVRYVVVTHRHSDHIGGVRPYVAAGAVLVAPVGAEPALRQLAALRRTLASGPVDRDPGEPRVEAVADRRVFQGAGRRVEVISTGGGSHVDAELLVYLPAQRLLYQGDFVTFPDYGGDAPDIPVTRELAALIRKLGLDVETIVGTHGRLGTLAELNRAVGAPAAQ